MKAKSIKGKTTEELGRHCMKVWQMVSSQLWLLFFYQYAELARATGGNLEMHNLTTCVIALKEK